MTAWVLIAYLSFGSNGGPVAPEFSSKEACQSAIAAMKEDRYLGARLVAAICVQKGGANG